MRIAGIAAMTRAGVIAVVIDCVKMPGKMRTTMSAAVVRLSIATVFFTTVTGGTTAEAQRFPQKPVRLIVPFTAGGGVDAVARVCAQKLTELLGEQVVIDNRAGSGGVIAAEIAAHSVPDGYTLFFGGSASHGVTPHLYRKLPYDAVRDFAPVTLIGATPYILAVHPAVAASGARDLIRLARAQPGALNYSSAGNGSTTHLTMEMFKSMTNINIVHVPYKGAVPALSDLLSGQVQVAFNPAVVVQQHVRSGRLRALAVSGLQRTRLMPELPTLAESALPGFEARGWYGLLAPAGVSALIVARLHDAMMTGLSDRDLQERFLVLGVDTISASPEEFARYIRSELVKWGRVVRDSGARAD